MGDDIARQESKVFSLKTMDSSIAEYITVDILLLSLADRKDYLPITAFTHTSQEKMATQTQNI